MTVMGPSPVAALDASYQSGRDIGRSGVGLNVQKTRRQLTRSVGRRRTTLASQGRGGAVMADDINRLARPLRWCGMAPVLIGCCAWLEVLISSCVNRVMPFWASRFYADLAGRLAKPKSQLLVAARRKA